MNDEAIFAPGFRTTPYWWEAAAPPSSPVTALPDQADAVIIGGGITGLSTALELARGGMAPLVLDREAIGWGASSRNGGALSGAGSLGRAKSDVSKGIDPALLSEMVDEAEASFDAFEALLARESIECDYVRCGRFVGAHSAAAMESLAKRAALLNAAIPGTAEILPRDRLAEELGTPRYHGGMVNHRAASLHPARYTQGLARAARRAGAALAGGVTVDGVAREGAGFLVSTTAGVIRARQVMVATNGYTGQALPWHRRRVVPVASYMVATAVLGRDRVAEVLPKFRVYGDTKKILYYFRPSPDGTRVLFGGRATLSDTDPRVGARWLHRHLVHLLPSLEGVRLTHGWKGNVAFAFDMLPHVGVQDGVHHALGCNGSGVVTMTHLGTVAARMMLGGDNRASAFSRMPMPTLPGYTGTPWFMPIVTGWYRMKDFASGWRVT